MVETAYSLVGKRVYVAGHNGMVGSSIVRRLAAEDCEIITVSKAELDLRDQSAVRSWFDANKPDAIFLAAARVGGILANNMYPVNFLYENLMIASNIIEAAHRTNADKLLFLGSSCIYPKFAPQPITEDALLTGPLEPTNEWYAIAKIAGLKLAQAYRKQYSRDFISAMPTNLYGPGDNYDLASSHVMPALIRKAHEAKQAGTGITVWGTGRPLREFLYVDDCADAVIYLMKNYSQAEHVNVGSGADVTILELTKLVCEVVGMEGPIDHDYDKPDGTPRKLMSSQRLAELGWRPSTQLREGIQRSYEWFLSNSVRSGVIGI